MFMTVVSFGLTVLLALFLLIVMGPLGLIGAILKILLSPGRILLVLALASFISLQAGSPDPAPFSPLSWGTPLLGWTEDFAFQAAVVGALLLIAEMFGAFHVNLTRVQQRISPFAGKNTYSGKQFASAGAKPFSKGSRSNSDSLAAAMSSSDLPDFQSVRRQYGAGGNIAD